MKKLASILMAIVLLATLSGCKETTKSTSDNTSITQNTTEKESTQNAEVTEPKASTETQTTESTEKMGMDLINSLEVSFPEALFIEGITKFEGMTLEQKLYIRGEDFRMESKSDFSNQVFIYNSTDGITYMYDDTMPTGTMMHDTSEEDEEEPMEDETFGMPYGDALFEGIENLLEAIKTVYNGYDVLYMHISDSSDGDTLEIKQWISTEFWYPIKMETSLNGKVISEYEVTHISSDEAKDAKLYEKPEGVDFLDLDSMMNIPQP